MDFQNQRPDYTMNDKEKIEKFYEIERIMQRYLPGGTLYLPTGKELLLCKVMIKIKKVMGPCSNILASFQP